MPAAGLLAAGHDRGALAVHQFCAAPRRVLAAQAAWRERLEAQPTRFMVEVLTPALRDAASHLAGFLGCDADGLGFVDNATAACNAVLRSIRFAPGDEILFFYPSTEWTMDRPFTCLCSSSECLGRVAGANQLDAWSLARHRFNRHILDQLAERTTTVAA